jgi:lipoprotein-anchoring transpeptidase ErfK/SrfK
MRKIILPVVATLCIFATGSSPARAEDLFSFLFGTRPAAREMVATYDDTAQVARETPSSTRELVDDPTNERPGAITIDTSARALYLSMPGGKAWRYSVGVGREGFTWRGRTHIGRKEEWPSWTPPSAMLKRRPDLPRHMEGGLDNPLGARAMYLYSSSRDTMFRIHGSNEPESIGRAVSSGCIRMLNDDVVDLFSRVKLGTTVVVL